MGRSNLFRICLLVGTVLLLVVARAGGASDVPDEARSVGLGGNVEGWQPANFSHLRVCAYPAFSLASKRCIKDQRARILVSSKFACSTTIHVRRPKRLRVRMTYRGEPVYQYTSRILGTGSSDWWISENLGSTPLPGGRWGCDFSFGSARAGASFRSGGPTGAVIGAAVCNAKDSLFYAHHRIRACMRDESTRPIPATSRILRSAVFVEQVGKKGEAQLLAGGKDAAKPDLATLPSPFSIWWTAFAPAAPAADGSFVPGDYVCRFSVNDVSAVEKPFRIISK
jgi:hypothetical protein